jgi:hypothetical protein
MKGKNNEPEDQIRQVRGSNGGRRKLSRLRVTVRRNGDDYPSMIMLGWVQPN